MLTLKILYNQIDLEAALLLKFFRKPGLRRSSFILLRQTGKGPEEGGTVPILFLYLPSAFFPSIPFISYYYEIGSHLLRT